jgi:hypothetical protein
MAVPTRSAPMAVPWSVLQPAPPVRRSRPQPPSVPWSTAPYGQLTLNGDGSYSYVRNPGSAGGVSDVFTYTVKDGDGDLVQTTLTIDIGNSTPEIGGLTPEANGGDVIVDEDDLLASRGSGESEGSDTIKESTTQGGDFTITSPDGVKTLVIEGVTVIANGALTGTLTVTTTLGNTLTVTGYNPGTGVVNYTYTLADNETHTRRLGRELPVREPQPHPHRPGRRRCHRHAVGQHRR